MRASRIILLLALALPLNMLLQHSPAHAKEAPVAALTKAQRSALMRVTCDAHGSAGLAEIQTWRTRPGRAGINAAVLCPALPRFRSLPMFRKYTCETSKGTTWTCGEKLHAIRIPVGALQVLVTYRKGQMSPVVAMQITHYIGAEHPLTFNGGYNLREMMLAGECRVTPAGPGAMTNSTNYLLACGQHQLIVGRLCIERRCRVYPVSYKVPPPP